MKADGSFIACSKELSPEERKIHKKPGARVWAVQDVLERTFLLAEERSIEYLEYQFSNLTGYHNFLGVLKILYNEELI